MNDIKDKIKQNYGKAIIEHVQKSRSQQTSCCQTSETINNKDLSTPSFGLHDSLVYDAKIKPGDVVVDFGSGAGHDVFKAAEIVGPKGQVIGIDFTPEMLIEGLKKTAEKGITNVDFRYSDIEKITSLPDNFADVIISDCVINLTSDKLSAFKEAFRILKSGGRLVDADNIALENKKCGIEYDSEDWCACVSGALTQEEYFAKLKEAGFNKYSVKDLETWNYKGSQYKSGIIEAIKP
ncbi:MAG: methyltransferase domain-containing protein [Candidatus Lokiarchaeota archaeon]|nr:methyltransferase domain-containing protein [Candidatus Lokiarchaeota archaeon]